jgi:response regulator NasT
MTRLSTDTDTPARWRVALLGLTGESLSTMTAAVTDAGGEVTIEAPARLDSLSLVADPASDVIVLQPSRTAGPRPDLLPFAESGRPLVLFTHNTSRALLKVAARSGVAAFLVAPLQPAQLAPTLDLAVARFSDREVLRQKLADRKVIERAKGRLMTVARLSEDDAFRWLRTRAMQTRSTLADVAHLVLGVAPDGTQAAAGASATPRTGRGPGAHARAPGP